MAVDGQGLRAFTPQVQRLVRESGLREGLCTLFIQHTSASLSIPIVDGALALGTWQGIYLWEHRHHAGGRRVVVHLGA